MTSENDAILDSLLAAWHQWQQVHHVRGFPSRAMGMEQFVASRQYDDSNGALDAALEQRTLKAVDFHAGQLEEPYKAAIYANARALVVGCAVFSSPRLPAERAARIIVIADARTMLVKRLQSAGVL